MPKRRRDGTLLTAMAMPARETHLANVCLPQQGHATCTLWWTSTERVISTEESVDTDEEQGRRELLSKIYGADEELENSYACMTDDANRNELYQEAIAHRNKTVPDHRQTRWLEIGPGADAVLTRMVLGSHEDARIHSIEGNAHCYHRLLRLLLQERRRARSGVFNGLSTNEDVLNRLSGPYHTVLHELIGCIASSEGSAHTIAHLKEEWQRRWPSAPFVSLPVQTATYWTPYLLTSTNIRAHTQLHVAGSAFAMLEGTALADRVWKPEIWGPAGVFDTVDYRWPVEQLRQKQHHVSEFKAQRFAKANGMVSWIWCQLDESRMHKNTGSYYPYEANKRCSGLRDFSSLCEDDKHCTSNWYNVFFPFERAEAVHFAPGDTLSTTVTVDLSLFRPTYKITIRLTRSNSKSSELLYRKCLRDLFPQWWNNDDEQ